MTVTTQPLALRVDVPIACFRKSRAREYAETYPVPPPSTIYGMLLSLVGEMNRHKHCGVKLAISLLSKPQQSTVIRTFRRFKKKEIHDPTNARPDYQELLTNIQFVVCIDAGEDTAQPTLPERLRDALTNPSTVRRFGGLCLGESRDLINSVSIVRDKDKNNPLQWLEQNEDGLLTLPYWVDHIGSKGTRWRRYHLMQPSKEWQPSQQSWTTIQSA
ncbi:type I-MYXAN CRISPR-associated protein Cas5/Cmx5/DevS [Lusitaniella coriacea LEGE 07157]|uniref:Type I-MYXAN CRISPR-associated protein Cas5/Cmx5/DevS n=1 Tax=Lusitaniella coriacea LEGE 07157 TaxID=945747 RepID=A0A8J7DU10_9CYAN|nr:type I-MYXAN CRISPR-associated protein Cas5/Cmx5/DevS [Lusitaniella coriacea]MBE9114711.1 type I-MYXAN CRISPR-associated protein Cas5/Cmx5/DevS [Lusitaniella coriacea LEGE 07157]